MDWPKIDPEYAASLVNSGGPFVPFSEISAQAIQEQPDEDVFRWVDSKLREGKPFVIRGLNRTGAWRKADLNKESLANFSARGAIPVRNCDTGRDVKLPLRDLLSQKDATPLMRNKRNSVREYLYAKDLQCPPAWIEALEAVLPSPLRYLGSLDLFRYLPKEVAPEVLMAYVGTRRSFSGFHRCFSATVSLNLIIETHDTGEPGSLCFGTDRDSQKSYDKLMEDLGKSAHTDWVNVMIDTLSTADFPVYVADQRPGDLVVFPAATAHQIWNMSAMVTKAVWNIMHVSSLESFFNYVQPVYQKQCHPDTGRVPLIPMCTLQNCVGWSKEKELALEVFRRLLSDEETEHESDISIKTVDTQGAVIECNFCGLTIWNRHLHCEQCGDFDLCLTCYVSGRSCKHVADYALAEILPRARSQAICQAALRAMSITVPQESESTKKKPLGAIAIAAMDARRQSTDRLCHLCRDSHPVWKGVECTQCSAFFCFRGLHRHFDIDLIPFLRNGDDWLCPKCTEICNCRCCHFPQAYQSKDKPVRARVKPLDSRGRVLGFIDNVFDQKRGKRASLMAPSTSPQAVLTTRGTKRPRRNTFGDELQESSSHGVSPAVYSGSSRIRAMELSEPHSVNSVAGNRNQIDHDQFSARSSTEVGRYSLPSDTGSTTYPHRRPSDLPPPAVTRDESTLRRHVDLRDGARADGPENEGSIRVLERKLDALRIYADDLLELSLLESHAKVQDRISQLEAELEQRKRQKAEVLLDNLNRDFPDLADVAREEARRRYDI